MLSESSAGDVKLSSRSLPLHNAVAQKRLVAVCLSVGLHKQRKPCGQHTLLASGRGCLAPSLRWLCLLPADARLPWEVLEECVSMTR